MFRLGSNLSSLELCPLMRTDSLVCGMPVSGGHHFLHFLTCPALQGLRTSCRHSPLVQEIRNFMREAGRVVVPEQPDPVLGPSARIDLLELPSALASRRVLDVTVISALGVGLPVAVSATVGVAAEQRYRHKLLQYPLAPPGYLLPLVWEAHGACHPGIPGLLRVLSGRRQIGSTSPHPSSRLFFGDGRRGSRPSSSGPSPSSC